MNPRIVESAFLAQVRIAFDELLVRGALRVTSSVYDERAFGNAAVVLSGRGFHVRLVRDRGEEFAEVWPLAGPEEWWPIQRVLRAIGVACAEPEGLLSAVDAADLIRRHLGMLESGLAPPRFSGTIQALRDLDAQALRRIKRPKERE